MDGDPPSPPQLIDSHWKGLFDMTRAPPTHTHTHTHTHSSLITIILIWKANVSLWLHRNTSGHCGALVLHKNNHRGGIKTEMRYRNKDKTNGACVTLYQITETHICCSENKVIKDTSNTKIWIIIIFTISHNAVPAKIVYWFLSFIQIHHIYLCDVFSINSFSEFVRNPSQICDPQFPP